jgi:hypothetical protein
MTLTSSKNVTAYNGPSFHGYRVQRIVNGYTLRLYVSATTSKTPAAAKAKAELMRKRVFAITEDAKSWTRGKLTKAAAGLLTSYGFTIVAR